MSGKINTLIIMIENAYPYDEYWSENILDKVGDYVSNFSQQEWLEIVSMLPLNNKKINYCLFEVIVSKAPNDILSLTIERKIDIICGDMELLDLLLKTYYYQKISTLNLKAEVKQKLKNACYNRLHEIETCIAQSEIKKKIILDVVNNL